ncbi:MAG: 2-amino-4-hydroxy-6-hydroxymethyldihydropteridine diphosphokinase [Crocinitomicaceae bacterium]|nr:2-amino-4-hydroxy-6-hydroxymethyldihydropteridine diphosphokinase [Crocinitomicaceae bacterium]
MESKIIYLSLGSNLGNRLDYINTAIDCIKKVIGPIISTSSMFETPPVGFEADTSFINCVISVETYHSPQKVLQLNQEIERNLGRKKKNIYGYESRIIDIDIILFGDLCIEYPELSIPHKEYVNRKFVLVPLQQLIPNHVDPNTHLTISQLLSNCSDMSKIEIIQ